MTLLPRRGVCLHCGHDHDKERERNKTLQLGRVALAAQPEQIVRKIKPVNSYAPIYCALYPDLAALVRAHGYALAVHGSLQRDFDLICVPWIANPSTPDAVVKDITGKMALDVVGNKGMKEHGREVWTITVGFGECFLDLSFMPCAAKEPQK